MLQLQIGTCIRAFVVFVASMLAGCDARLVQLPAYALHSGGGQDSCNWRPVEKYVTGRCPDMESPLTVRNVKSSYDSGCSLLILAINARNTKAIKELIEKGADPTRCSPDPDVLLHILLPKCNEPSFGEALGLLVRSEFRPVRPDVLFNYALSCPRILRIAIAAGAQINTKDRDGKVPLDNVTKFPTVNRIESAILLVESGADPGLLERPLGQTPIEFLRGRVGKAPNWAALEEALRRNSGR